MNAHKVFWAEFLEMYKSLPALWKVKDESYSNRVKKAAAYNKLVEKLKEIDPKANREKVIKKINILRTSYRRELKKLKIFEEFGGGDDDVFQSSLWYFDLLHFLAEQTDQEGDSKAKDIMSGNRLEPPVKRRKVKDDDPLECEKFKERNNAATSILAKNWASQYVEVKMNAHQIFWYEFLEMYKSLPVLWKVNNENYSNREEKAAAYDKLVDKLKEIDPAADRRAVSKKINIFRTNYRRELKKMKRNQESGADGDDVFQPTLWYFDLLNFLADQEVDSKAKGAVSDNDSASDKSRHEVKEEDILKMAYEKLKEGNDVTSVLAKGWATQYAELSNEQRVLARTIWADVLFHGCMNRLTEGMVEDVHHVLKRSPNTSISMPTSQRSSATYYEEY